MEVQVFSEIPREILDKEPRQIREVFAHPSLVHIEGLTSEAVFVSIMLHGNETTGFYCLQNLVKWLNRHPLKRSLIVFIGNVMAAEKGLRQLPSQIDFNRVWKSGDSPEHVVAQQVKDYLKQQSLFAAIDIHNNSGKNPIYACIVNKEYRSVYLASLFTNTIVYFENPNTVMTTFTGTLCPSVVLECGYPGNYEGIEKATDFVTDLFNLSSLDSHENLSKKVCVFHTVGRLVIPADRSVSFDFNSNADLKLCADLVSYNFSTLPKGFVIGQYKDDISPLQVFGDFGEDLTKRFLSFDSGKVRLNSPYVPSMLTEDLTIIKNDCLGYFMQPFDILSSKC